MSFLNRRALFMVIVIIVGVISLAPSFFPFLSVFLLFFISWFELSHLLLFLRIRIIGFKKKTIQI